MAKKKALWEELRNQSGALPAPPLRLLGTGHEPSGKGGRSLSIAGYKIAQKFLDLTKCREIEINEKWYYFNPIPDGSWDGKRRQFPAW
ncbi:MAG: hypothetical protein ACLUAR_03665 [Pilosibacter sp.]